MQENHMGWKLVTGVRHDLINLFKLFVNTKSVRYENFCKLWKDTQLSLIYSNRTVFIELLEFTEELFQIGKEYLLSVFEFPTRVAALYTLYGLYFKQPLRDGVKIRFTMSEWEETHSLIIQCKKEKHYDVVFIFLKMFLEGAFNFTATIRVTGLERGFRKYFNKRTTLLNHACDVELLYRPLIDEKLMDSFIQLESLYCKKKIELLGKNNIDFIDGKFSKNLQQELKDYADESKKKTYFPYQKNFVDSNDQGALRTEIKTKSYTLKNNDNKDANEIASETETDTEAEAETETETQNSNYLELLAKKKAEFFLKKLQEESIKEEEDSNPSSFDLPVLDLS